jgi:hypothetical protein
MSKNMAIIDANNIVVNIICCNDFEIETKNKITYTQTNPAYIGGDYIDGYFYAPQPYSSWVRNKGTWESPIPYPNDGKVYEWNETTQEWKELNV